MTHTQATTTPAAQGGGQGGSHPTLPSPPTPPTPPTEGSSTVPPYYRNPDDIPEGAVIISIAFFAMVAFVLVGFPIARALARRMDRGALTPPALPREVAERLAHIETSVDSIALEVERISEGQRFTTKLLAEKHGDAVRIVGNA